jgi:hypothetical protein
MCGLQVIDVVGTTTPGLDDVIHLGAQQHAVMATQPAHVAIRQAQTDGPVSAVRAGAGT